MNADTKLKIIAEAVEQLRELFAKTEATINVLPNNQSKHNSITFLRTAALWTGQAAMDAEATIREEADEGHQ